MPRPRKYKTNAERQAAYRKRLKAGKVKSQNGDALTERVLRSYRAAEGA